MRGEFSRASLGHWPDLTGRARIATGEAGVARCRRVWNQGMPSESQLNPYRCDQCGAANVVAAPVLYQEGTRTYSGTFYSGVTQSHAALAVAPPKPRGYLRPFILWGPAIIILAAWASVGMSAIYKHPSSSVLRSSTVALFLLLCAGANCGMIASLRRIARHNRDIYPHLYRTWERTFICRRCGRALVLPL